MDHPLHRAVADKIAQAVVGRIEIIRDPACGGVQQLPLFVGKCKGRDSRMCCVDLLLITGGQVCGIVEIEESGFLPTKICGKFLQAALSDHFIHDTRGDEPVPYGKRVLFVQVLDGSACLKERSQKKRQGQLIERDIRQLLPLRGITDYCLFFVNGPGDQDGLDDVSAKVSQMLAEPSGPK